MKTTLKDYKIIEYEAYYIHFDFIDPKNEFKKFICDINYNNILNKCNTAKELEEALNKLYNDCDMLLIEDLATHDYGLIEKNIYASLSTEEKQEFLEYCLNNNALFDANNYLK